MKALIATMVALSGAVFATAAPLPPTDLTVLVAQEGQARLPRVTHAGAVSYLNGGAGSDEAAYMKVRAREFPLQIVFSGRGGEYGVADRLTVVTRSGAQVAVVRDAGPYLLMQLPPGRYTIEAEFDGTVERRSVTIGSGTRRMDWRMPNVAD